MSAQYFTSFDDRKPYQPIRFAPWRNLLFQFLGVVFVLFGCFYLYWRWTSSLNPDGMWFAIPLVVAETLSFFGSILALFAAWDHFERKQEKPIRMLSELRPLELNDPDRPISIDVYIASYNEELELLKYTVADAKAMRYAHGEVKVNTWLLDDGRRDGRDPEKENLKAFAKEEGIGYFVRENNEGYKAGNLNNAFYKTEGDLIVILDADTRPFPDFLNNTTGYFRQPKMAWVQTPQWFYDLTEGIGMDQYLNRMTNGKFKWLIRPFSPLLKHWKTGEDIFGNDPQLFYDIILRRRNYHNAAFCCGAGSVHRRTALEEHADKDYIKREGKDGKRPFAHHASEDIYTSLMLHSEPKGWISYQHRNVECKMLSPQNLDDWVKQRRRYADGSLDIGFSEDSPAVLNGLSLRQRLCYFSTFYSYLSPFWNVVFLLSPFIFFVTLTPPVKAFNFDFFKYFIPFIVLNNLVFALLNWGISTKRSEQYYVSSFWLVLGSLWRSLVGKEVRFNVTNKKKSISQLSKQHAYPHMLLVAITLAGLAYNGYLIYNNTHPSYSAFTANCFWVVYNLYQLNPFIRAAYWKET